MDNFEKGKFNGPPFFDDVLQCQAVAVEAEAADGACAVCCDQVLLAEGLPVEDVADVHFNHGAGGRPDSVGEGDGGVRVGSGVQDDPAVVASLRDGFGQEPLLLFLQVVDVHLRVLVDQLAQIVLEGTVSVDVHLPGAQLAKIHAVDDEDLHAFSSVVYS